MSDEVKIESAEPKIRRLIIETDGNEAHIASSELSPLEAKMIFTMFLEQMKR